jgi:hypothetical protein
MEPLLSWIKILHDTMLATILKGKKTRHLFYFMA